jgi:hypothetical protein
MLLWLQSTNRALFCNSRSTLLLTPISFRRFVFRALFVIFLGYTSCGLAQQPAAASSQQPECPANTRPIVVPQGAKWFGSKCEPAWKVPYSADYWRYLSFFNQVKSWEDAGKHFDDVGKPDYADAWRKTLEERSGLTAEEASIVKRIALQWEKDHEDQTQVIQAVAAKARLAHPHEWGESLYRDAPEIPAAIQVDRNLMTVAIARLNEELGTKSFAKVDLFATHWHDHSQALFGSSSHAAQTGGGK